MNNLLDEYLLHLKTTRSGSVCTQDSYRRDITNYLRFIENEGIENLDQVDKSVFLKYTKELKNGEITGTALSDASFSRAISAIRSFYRYLCRFHSFQNNPAASLKRGSTEKKLPDFLTFEQMQRLLCSFNLEDGIELRNRCMIEIIYACGLRVSEAAEIKLSKLDLNQGFLAVTGKGQKERIIPFYEGIGHLVARYIMTVRADLIQQEHDILFVSKQGNPITTRAIQMILKESALKAGLSVHVHPHMLRHSFATHLLDNGADLRMVQELLGHQNLSTTQIYTHITVDRLKKAVSDAHPHAKKGK